MAVSTPLALLDIRQVLPVPEELLMEVVVRPVVSLVIPLVAVEGPVRQLLRLQALTGEEAEEAEDLVPEAAQVSSRVQTVAVGFLSLDIQAHIT